MRGFWSVCVSRNWRVTFRFAEGDGCDVDLIDYHEGTIEMKMKNPPHPGTLVREECINPLGLTVTDAAAALGVTRQALNNVINGKAGISPEMAIRLAQAFGSTAEFWLGLQMDYDLAQAQKNAHRIKLKRIARKEPASI
jgi:addiction module HigA family antidote